MSEMFDEMAEAATRIDECAVDLVENSLPSEIAPTIVRDLRVGMWLRAVIDHHERYPTHGSDCACLDMAAGNLRRLLFGELPREPPSEPDEDCPFDPTSSYRPYTRLSIKRMSALHHVFRMLAG